MPTLAELFPALDRVVENFLNEHQEIQADVLRYRWDAPDRMLVFPSRRGNGVRNNIHLLYLPEQSQIRVSAAAWQDADVKGILGPRVRRWTHSSPEQSQEWLIRVTPKGLADPKAASAALSAAYEAISTVGISDLIIETPIP